MELLYGLFIIKDCLKLISEGKDYHIITISSQLRGIFLDTEGGKHKALFFEVMDYLGLASIVYIKTKAEEKPDIDGLVFEYGINYPHLRPIKSKDLTMISIEDWLNLPILRIKDKEVSSKMLIGIISDKLGGAHYDPEIEKWKWELKYMQILDVKILNNALIQLTEVLLNLSWNLVRVLSNWSYYIEFGVKYNDLVSQKKIISFFQGTSKMSVSFILNIDESLVAKFVGPQGNSIEVSVLDKVDFTINSVGINYYISPDFEYYLDVIDKGKICKHIKLPYPIFIDSRLFKYKTIIYGDDNLTVGIINQAQYMNVLNERGIADLYQRFLVGRTNVDVFFNKVETVKDNNYLKHNSENYKTISYDKWISGLS